ncbi:MAG: hypothetical protein ACI9W6_002459 [Motiliproteus sp.]|jgi:hypothetical protein
MTKLTVFSLFLVISLPGFAVAEPLALRCVYTRVTFDAPHMSGPETRVCPQERCVYALRFDTEAAQGSVNGVEGYLLTVDDRHFTLRRQARNRIVGGVDSAYFSVNRNDLSYLSRKSTPPGVSLETRGQCQPIP